MTHYEYDRSIDSAYVRFSDLPHDHSEIIDDSRFIDYAADGSVIGVELLYVGDGVSIDGLPRAGELATLLRANSVPVHGKISE